MRPKFSAKAIRAKRECTVCSPVKESCLIMKAEGPLAFLGHSLLTVRLSPGQPFILPSY